MAYDKKKPQRKWQAQGKLFSTVTSIVLDLIENVYRVEVCVNTTVNRAGVESEVVLKHPEGLEKSIITNKNGEGCFDLKIETDLMGQTFVPTVQTIINTKPVGPFQVRGIKLPILKINYFKAAAVQTAKGFRVDFKGQFSNPIGDPVVGQKLNIVNDENRRLNKKDIITFQNERFQRQIHFGPEMAGKTETFFLEMEDFPIRKEVKVTFPKEPAPGKVELKIYYNKKIRPSESKKKDEKGNWEVNLTAELIEDGKPIAGQPINFVDGLREVFATRKTRKTTKLAHAKKFIPLHKAGKPMEFSAKTEYKGKLFRSDTIKFDLPKWPDHLNIKPKSRFGKELFPQAILATFAKWRTWLHLVPMYFLPSLTLVAFDRLGNIGSSIFFAVLVALFLAWTSKDRTIISHGLQYGLALGVANIIVPQIFSEVVIMAAWIFLALGFPTWFVEEITPEGVNTFPWFILYLCFIGAGIAFFIGIVAVTMPNSHYLNYFYNLLNGYTEGEVRYWQQALIWFNTKFPENGFLLIVGAIISRILIFLSWLLLVYKITMAGAICFAVAAPGEIKKWIDSFQLGNLRELFAGILAFFGFKKAQGRRGERT